MLLQAQGPKLVWIIRDRFVVIAAHSENAWILSVLLDCYKIAVYVLYVRE